MLGSCVRGMPRTKLKWLCSLSALRSRIRFGDCRAVLGMRTSSIERRSLVTIMVIAIAEIKSSAKTREELQRGLCSLVGQTESEAGCVGCQLWQAVSKASRFRFESRWNTQNDLLRHIQSDTYRRLLLFMELGMESPGIVFYTVSELRGFDLIIAARRRESIPEL